MRKPIVALTMGDPAGIGPEIIVKAMTHAELFDECSPLVIGDAAVLEEALKRTGLTESLRLQAVCTPSDGVYSAGNVNVMDLHAVDMSRFAFGRLSAMCGNAAYLYVERAIALAMSGIADATVTAPLNKEALNLAGHHYSGHTEIYAALTGCKRYCMLLAYDNMLISHVSTHVSLREACDRVRKERIGEVAALTAEAARKLTGKANPRIAVAGLNPHCGENGLFGDEEKKEIEPAVEALKKKGMDAVGPIPPDTVFSKLHGGWYDAVIAMYHDQGHIPLKTLGFIYNPDTEKWESVAGVNITLGLPIIRTSVDHGTAFDLAGTGAADETSMLNAIRSAIKLI